MGLIAMSERDLQRIEVLSKVVAGRMTMVSAAHVLAEPAPGSSPAREVANGGRSRDPAQGARPAVEQSLRGGGVRDYALAIVRERYADFGPTLAAEKLAERRC